MSKDSLCIVRSSVFVELDEAEGFILLGRRREKDFPSTWALLAGEDAHLLACIFAGRRRARAVSSDMPRDNAASTTAATQCVLLNASSRGGSV